ncbi:MAG TPA: lysophospholipid acyltransferase family protein [Candidatus Kapabacteria bacterium]|nr:lysophospholipid acyltransferase family protein [Candidatus Kapabacteria bacterium]
MTFRKKIKYFLIRKAAKLLILGIIKTCKFKISGYEAVEKLREQGIPIIYAYWHRHIFVTIYRFMNTGARPLISLSEDGEIVAQIALEFGMHPIRGSSSRGGAKAFITLLNAIKEEKSEVLITADGPKGPVREVKDGVTRLARKTGAVIVPIAWHSGRVKIFEKSWDRFKVPLPFGVITYAYGKPVTLPGAGPKDDEEIWKQRLKEAIDLLENEVEKGQTKKEHLKL